MDIIKAPKIQSIPDILTLTEVEQLIGATRKLRYRVFLLTTYSMGLRLGEKLALEVGDIDAQGLLGHASPTTTARYTHLTTVTDQDAAATINHLVNGLKVDLRRL